jgi:two-component system, OmpR family, alkaline phosphatase synthesis response regulator PhoP
LASEQKEILIIDYSAARRSDLRALLLDKGYSVVLATNSQKGIKMATGDAFDLILIESMQPTCNHLTTCHDIRETGIATPILVLTDRIEPDDRLFAIRLGADDYLTKPFDTAELLRRMEALFERAPFRSLESRAHGGAIKVDVRHARLTRDGKPVSMTSREFRLIQYLIKRPGRCVSRGELLRAVWGYASNSTTRTIDVHIASLRKKLEANPKTPKLIRTIPKVGYMFVGVNNTLHPRLRSAISLVPHESKGRGNKLPSR